MVYRSRCSSAQAFTGHGRASLAVNEGEKKIKNPGEKDRATARKGCARDP